MTSFHRAGSRTNRLTFRLQLEALEERTVPSLSDPVLLPGDTAPAPAVEDQFEPQIARGVDGFLAVWSDHRTVLRDLFLRNGGGPYFDEGLGNMTDVFAARLDANGALIDTTPIVVSEAEYYQTSPRVGWNGENWLVAWTTQVDRYESAIHAVRVAPDGSVLDSTPIVVHHDDQWELKSFSVASDGNNWVVVWKGVADGNPLMVTIDAARVSANGVVLDPGGRDVYVQELGFFWGIDLTFAGDEFLLTWRDNSAGPPYAVRGRLLTPALDPIGPAFTIHTQFDQPNTQVATNGAEFFVVWGEDAVLKEVRGSRISHTGQVLDPGGILLVNSSLGGLEADVTWDGANWLVTYARLTNGVENPDIFAARVAPNGTLLDPNGFLVAGGANYQSHPAIAQGVTGKAVLVWTDSVPSRGREDIHTAALGADYAVGPEAAVSLGAPRHSVPRIASGGGGFLAVFPSETSRETRILAHRLNAAGVPLDSEPIEVARGDFRDPAVAWNGSVFLVVWAGPGTGLNQQIFGRRLASDGTFLDPVPVSLMAGMTPDVAALGSTFLVVGIFLETTQIQNTRAVRVGGDGTVLGPPSQLGQNFDRFPRVAAFADRWLVVWQRHSTHDNPSSVVLGAFVAADGTSPGRFTIGGSKVPHLAIAGDTALVVMASSRSASANIMGRRIRADGTFLDGTTFVISDAPQMQYLPAAAWDGNQFLVTWLDHRNEGFPRQQRGDIFAARVSADGTVLDPSGFVVADSPRPEETPTVAAAKGVSVFAYAGFVAPPPYANLRIALRTLGGTVPRPTVTGVQVGDGSQQRSRVTSLTVTFNMPVTFAGAVANAFTLTRNGGGSVAFEATASIVGGVTIVTLNNFTGSETQFGSLRDGRFTLTALASQISNAGNQLNGGINYIFGDAQGLFRMFGDFNGDRQVDGFDFGAFSSTFNLTSASPNFLALFDVNGDGQIDGFDFSHFSARFNTVLP